MLSIKKITIDHSNDLLFIQPKHINNEGSIKYYYGNALKIMLLFPSERTVVNILSCTIKNKKNKNKTFDEKYLCRTGGFDYTKDFTINRKKILTASCKIKDFSTSIDRRCCLNKNKYIKFIYEKTSR